MNIKLLALAFSPAFFVSVENATTNTFSIILSSPKVMTVEFGGLKSNGLSKFGEMSYFGFKGDIPEKKEIDFVKSLESLWKYKIDNNKVSPATKKSYRKIINRYDSVYHSTTDVRTVSENIRNILDNTKPGMHFSAMCLKYKLTETQCIAFVHSALEVDETMMLSFAFTEVFPYLDGDKNIAMANTLLSTAGEEYISSLPALHDDRLSFGWYQLTSYAVRKDKHHTEGANQISNLSEAKIPDSVLFLSKTDHHRAAYYFASYNLMRLFKKASDEQARSFLNNCVHDRAGITGFIASAHHNPKHGIKNALDWIDEKCYKDISQYQGKALKKYVVKTAINFKALTDETEEASTGKRNEG